ncbi:unnamed protein product, partial [Prorocentrum cordatum]
GIRTEVAQDGWGAMITPSTASLKSASGCRGGDATFVLKHPAATSWERVLSAPACKGFQAVTFHLQRGSVVVIAFYLFPGDNLGGANTERLRSVGRFVETLDDPWAIIGDWNPSMEQLQASQFMQLLDGVLPRPDVDVTCAAGSGASLVDFAVAKCLGKALLSRERSRKQPQEGRKRSHRTRDQRQRRREGLDPNLRAAFDDLADASDGGNSQFTEPPVAFHVPQEAWEDAEAALGSLRAPSRVGDAWAFPGGAE